MFCKIFILLVLIGELEAFYSLDSFLRNFQHQNQNVPLYHYAPPTVQRRHIVFSYFERPSHGDRYESYSGYLPYPMRKFVPTSPAVPMTTTKKRTTTTTTTRKPIIVVSSKSIDSIINGSGSYRPNRGALKTSISIAQTIFNIARDIDTKLSKNSKFTVISPISIATTLAELMLGANGKTNDQLMGFFNIEMKSTKVFHENFAHLIGQMKMHMENTKLQKPYADQKETFNMTKSGKGDNNVDINGNDVGNDDVNIIHKINTMTSTELRLANGIFIENEFTLNQNYRKSVEAIYQSQITSLELRRQPDNSRKFINDWITQKTNGKIQNIMADRNSIDTKANMIIASTTYFKGLWRNMFIDGATIKRNFYPNGKCGQSSPKIVEMMATVGEFLFYDAKEYGCRILGLPYEDSATMYVILPYNSNKLKLRQLQEKLDGDRIDEIITKMKRKNVLVNLPKMQLSGTINLKAALSELGITELFDGDNCDLGGMTDSDSDAVVGEKHKSNGEIRKTSAITNDHDNDGDIIANDAGILKDRKIPVIRDVKNRRQFIQNLKREHENKNKASNYKLPNLFIDEFLHKVDLTINETGTEGAAVTISYLTRKDCDAEFRVDAPFMFFIRHDTTKLPLFYGSVFEP